jgi:cytochrome c oxidase subunit II
VSSVRAWVRFLGAVLLLAAGCAGTAREADREIRMVTRQFEYDPPEIVIRQGERVRLVIESADVTHGFGIPEWQINRQVLPGRPLVIELRPDRPGRYQIVCTVFCGTGHGDHKGWIVVEGN